MADAEPREIRHEFARLLERKASMKLKAVRGRRKEAHILNELR
jgi:hypothetical protein